MTMADRMQPNRIRKWLIASQDCVTFPDALTWPVHRRWCHRPDIRGRIACAELNIFHCVRRVSLTECWRTFWIVYVLHLSDSEWNRMREWISKWHSFHFICLCFKFDEIINYKAINTKAIMRNRYTHRQAKLFLFCFLTDKHSMECAYTHTNVTSLQSYMNQHKSMGTIIRWQRIAVDTPQTNTYLLYSDAWGMVWNIWPIRDLSLCHRLPA